MRNPLNILGGNLGDLGDFCKGLRLGMLLNGQKGKRYTDERSYVSFGSAWREADDQHKRINGNVFYEYTPDSKWLSMLRTDYDYQNTDLAAVNYAGFIKSDWATGTYLGKELNEIKDRRMKTLYHRLTLRADSQPFQAWGENQLSFKAYLANRGFKNINNDRIGIGASYESSYIYTIQYPMNTRQYGFSLKDRITWNDTFSGQLGVRYDHEKVKPRDLNAPCGKACTAEGKPAGKAFSIWNGFAGVDMQFAPVWKIGYQISTGHRTPTASEMYFTFTNPYGTWQSNPNLKPERSLTHTLSLQGNGSKGTFDLGVYHSRYRDFLVEKTTLVEKTEYGRTFQTPVQQTVNLDKARISGLEFKGRLNLDTVLPVSEGWKLMGGLGYSRSKLSIDSSLLSTQPMKAIIGLDYEQPEGKWGVFSRLTYLGAKKPRDAKVEEVRDRCVAYEFDPWFGRDICTRIEQYQEVVTAPHLNSSAYVFDLYGFYKPTKKLTLRAGVYNAFNRKYHTWDALRGINDHSTTHTVDREGKGLQRLYSPGRNYAVSLEYKF
ncbi:TonB-dependent receptor [Neisseria wadsworthii]|nr:TonB-dependent receptor [Neisseria wadsworthii]QMT35019.1 TonB-dependent receptor [Neisseria wadsworthii]